MEPSKNSQVTLRTQIRCFYEVFSILAQILRFLRTYRIESISVLGQRLWHSIRKILKQSENLAVHTAEDMENDLNATGITVEHIQ